MKNNTAAPRTSRPPHKAPGSKSVANIGRRGDHFAADVPRVTRKAPTLRG